MLCLNFLHQPGGILALSESLAENNDSSVFKLRSIQISVELIWSKMFNKMRLFYAFFCTFFVAFTYYAMFQYHPAKKIFSKEKEETQMTGFMQVNLIYSLAYCVFGLWFEIIQLNKQGFRKYFWSQHSVWNYFDLLTYINVIVFVIM